MKRADDSEHRKFIGEQQCLVCGRSPCEAAHIRFSDARVAKVNPGIGAKPEDCWLVPLCPDCHRGLKGQHTRGEYQWWLEKGIDPIPIALALRVFSGNHEKAGQIIRHAYFHS